MAEPAQTAHRRPGETQGGNRRSEAEAGNAGRRYRPAGGSRLSGSQETARDGRGAGGAGLMHWLPDYPAGDRIPAGEVGRPGALQQLRTHPLPGLVAIRTSPKALMSGDSK